MKAPTKSVLAGLMAIKSLFSSLYPEIKRETASWSLDQRPRGMRNPKDQIKRAAIVRRRKAKRLSMLSKPKRRAAYYHNLRNPQKIYA